MRVTEKNGWNVAPFHFKKMPLVSCLQHYAQTFSHKLIYFLRQVLSKLCSPIRAAHCLRLPTMVSTSFEIMTMWSTDWADSLTCSGISWTFQQIPFNENVTGYKMTMLSHARLQHHWNTTAKQLAKARLKVQLCKRDSMTLYSLQMRMMSIVSKQCAICSNQNETWQNQGCLLLQEMQQEKKEKRSLCSSQSQLHKCNLETWYDMVVLRDVSSQCAECMKCFQ